MKKHSLNAHLGKIARMIMIWLLAVYWPLAGSRTAWALNGQLLIEIDPSTANLRTAAPIDMTWNVQWIGKSILEGHFDMEVHMGDQVVARCKSHDVVLTPGEQRIRIRIPSLGSPTYWTLPELHLKWVTKNKTLNAGTYPLMGRPGYRALSLCVCQGDENRTHSHEDTLIKSLHLERLVSDHFPVKLNTTTTYWNRDDVPTSPLRFCAFDMVVATRLGFVNLRAKQLDVLDRWVRAGGSLCILVGEELPENQLNYLNRLSGVEERGSVFLSDGRITPTDEQAMNTGFWLTSRGLGRLAVVNAQKVGESIDPKKNLRRIACHLWSVRHAEADKIITDKILDASLTKGQSERIQQKLEIANQSSLSVGGQLVNCLMPRDVHVVPLGLIAIILAGYLVLIGPVDYFVLGFFKLRRWTWITFPLVTLATTGLCVKISQSYLSSQNTGHSLTIHDVDTNGHLIRENCLQMVFTSTRREVTTRVQQKIFTVMDHQRLEWTDPRIRYARGRHSMGVGLPHYQGHLPVDFVVTQTVPQWTPLLYRTMSIPKEDRTITFPWNRAKMLLTTNQGRQELAKMVQTSHGTQATALVMNRDRQFQLLAGQAGSGTPIRQDYPVQRAYRQGMLSPIENRNSKFLGIYLATRPTVGLTRLLSHISSHGGDNFEDLAVFDQSDPSQWLLIITLNQQEDLVMLRCLYTGVTP